jgi:hypothetical protein
MKMILKNKTSVTVLIVVVLATLAVAFLTGAGGEPAIGRYQLFCVAKGNFTDVYVIDTTTGAVKWVGNDEGKPFDAIKGR